MTFSVAELKLPSAADIATAEPPSIRYSADTIFELPVAASSTLAVAVTLIVPLVGFGLTATFDTAGGSGSTTSVAHAPVSENELLLPASSVPRTHTW